MEQSEAQTLPKPDWRSDCGRVALYHRDCIPLLPSLRAAGVDFLISDPPYGINFNQSGKHGRFSGAGRTVHASARGNHPILGDDRPFDPMPLLAFRHVMLWGADHFYKRLPDSGRWLAWNKLRDLKPWDSFADVEFAWHSAEGAARIFSMLWKGLACDRSGENGGLRLHPTQKPIRIMVWCLDQAKVPIGGTVLDPYMGSGTTGIACLRSGRSFIGIDLDPKNFAIARDRIAAELANGELFAAPPLAFADAP